MSGVFPGEIHYFHPAKDGLISVTDDAVSYIFNQTYGPHEYHLIGSTGKQAVPGTFYDWAGGTLRGVISCTGQAVILRAYLREQDDGASTDWELDSNFDGDGQLTIAAGTVVPFEWPIIGIGRMDILNGGTGPTLLHVTGLHWTPDPTPSGT